MTLNAPIFRHPAAVPLAALLVVVAAIFLLRPSAHAVVWERIKPRHERVIDQRVYRAAEARGDLRLTAGRYFYRDQQGKRMVEATLTFQGDVGRTPTPFEYVVTVIIGKAERRSVSGQASVKGQVLTLAPERENLLLLSPKDRSLLQQVTARSFDLVSPESRDDAADSHSRFTRQTTGGSQ